MRHTRVALFAGVLVVTVVAVSLMAGVPHVTSSVPNRVSFQAKVNDLSGNPVADGNYNVLFRIYPNETGGPILHGDLALVSTVDGVFTYDLGSDPIDVLPSNLFQDYDSLWLEVQFDDEVLSPRTLLVSAPHARVADGLEVRSWTDPAVSALWTSRVSHQLSQYGTDGGEQIRLYGGSWGEILLDATDLNSSSHEVNLSSNGGSGGILRLRKPSGADGATLHSGASGAGATLSLTNDVGTPTIFMDGDQSGDAAVQLPGSSISSIECGNEPGVASDADNFGFALTGALDVLVSRSLTAPTNGYILAIGTAQATLSHTNGTTTAALFGVSDNAAAFPSVQDVAVQLPAAATGGAYAYAVTVQSIFTVNSGPNTIYYLADLGSGAVTIADMQLSLLFVPTSYGTVDPPASSGNSATDGGPTPDVAAERLQAEAFHIARLEMELASVRAQADETARRLAELEAKADMEQSHSNPAKPQN